ncbi:translocation/assembly module TamB domain-containing protein, partial [bacterium]|nr:translocation/assembly module TamB domain-containing protein [bacterium]
VPKRVTKPKPKKPKKRPRIEFNSIQVVNGKVKFNGSSTGSVYILGSLRSSPDSLSFVFDSLFARLDDGFTIGISGKSLISKGFLYADGRIVMPKSDFEIKIDSFSIDSKTFANLSIVGDKVDYDEINRLLGAKILSGSGVSDLNIQHRDSLIYEGKFAFNGDLFGLKLATQKGHFTYDESSKSGIVKFDGGALWGAPMKYATFLFRVGKDTFHYKGIIKNLRKFDLRQFNVGNIRISGDFHYSGFIEKKTRLALFSKNARILVDNREIKDCQLLAQFEFYKNGRNELFVDITSGLNRLVLKGTKTTDSSRMNLEISAGDFAEVIRLLGGGNVPLTGEVRGNASLTGAGSELKVSGRLESDSLRISSLVIRDCDLPFSGEIKNGKPDIRLNFIAKNSSVSNKAVELIQLTGNLTGEGLLVRDLSIFAGETRISGAGELDFKNKSALINGFDVFSPLADVRLNSPFELRFVEGLAAHDFDVTFGDGRIIVDTLNVSKKSAKIVGTINGISLEQIYPLKDVVGGKLSSEFDLELNLGTFKGNGFLVGVVVEPKLRNFSWDTARVELEVRQDTIKFKRTILRKFTDSLIVQGNVLIEKKRPTFNLVVYGNGNAKNIFAGYSGDAKFLDGNVGINVKLKGTKEHPELYGKISLEDGALLTDVLDDTLRNLTLLVKLRDSIIYIDSVSGEIRTIPIEQRGLFGKIWELIAGKKYVSGNFHGGGNIRLWEHKSNSMSVLLFVNNLPIKSFSEGIYAIVDGEVELRGFPLKVIADLRPSEAHILKLGSSSPAPMKIPINIDVAISSDNIWVLTNEMEALISGDLYITSADNRKLLFLGDLKIESGKYFLYGQVFEIESGVIRFRDISTINPELDILAKTTIGQEEIFLKITGNLYSPQVKMYSSSGEFTPEDIVKLFIGAGDTSTTSMAERIQSQTRQLLQKYIESNLGKLAERTLGLDEVKITTYGDNNNIFKPQELTLTLGKSVTRKLYLRYTQTIAEDPRQQIELSYKISKNLYIGFQQDVEGNYKLKLDLKWEY